MKKIVFLFSLLFALAFTANAQRPAIISAPTWHDVMMDQSFNYKDSIVYFLQRNKISDCVLKKNKEMIVNTFPPDILFDSLAFKNELLYLRLMEGKLFVNGFVKNGKVLYFVIFTDDNFSTASRVTKLDESYWLDEEKSDAKLNSTLFEEVFERLTE